MNRGRSETSVSETPQKGDQNPYKRGSSDLTLRKDFYHSLERK